MKPSKIKEILNSHAIEIMKQVGFENVRLGVSVHKSGGCIRVSVKPDRVKDLPKKITVTTDKGNIEIPIDVHGDYEELKLH